MKRSTQRRSHSNDKMVPLETVRELSCKSSEPRQAIKRLHNRKTRYRPIAIEE